MAAKQTTYVHLQYLPEIPMAANGMGIMITDLSILHCEHFMNPGLPRIHSEDSSFFKKKKYKINNV